MKFLKNQAQSKGNSMRRIILILLILMLLPACIPKTPCQLTATDTVTAYNRPSAAANIFGTLSVGDSVQPDVKTSDGFYGFEPGVAQAGNVGVFRNRWILKTYQVDLTGSCSSLPVVVGPIANLCYAMVMGDTPVYTSADTTSAVITTLHLDDYTHVIGSSPGWAQVALNVGSPSLDNTGWIQESSIGYNGDC